MRVRARAGLRDRAPAAATCRAARPTARSARRAARNRSRKPARSRRVQSSCHNCTVIGRRRSRDTAQHDDVTNRTASAGRRRQPGDRRPAPRRPRRPSRRIDAGGHPQPHAHGARGARRRADAAVRAVGADPDRPRHSPQLRARAARRTRSRGSALPRAIGAALAVVLLVGASASASTRSATR